MPFFTPTPESFCDKTVVGIRICLIPLCETAEAYPTRSRIEPPPIAAILTVAYYSETFLQTLPFIGFFAFMIFVPLSKAIEKPEGPRIGKAVKSGVISLIIMNAAWAAAFGDLSVAAIILFLLPVSILLARLFAVT